MAMQTCDCYPGGFSPATYEGPQEHCPIHGRPAPAHRSDRHQDACSLVCQAAYEGGGNCDTYVGRHRAGVRG